MFLSPKSRLIVVASVLTATAGLRADEHPTGVPALTSKAGAAYTIYLDFAGFNFTGTWGTGTKTPGAIPAYNLTGGDATVFTSTEIADMKKVWARVAEKYAEWNVNVTTVDPAASAGLADTDAHRQAYYDSQAKMMHTIIGGGNDWYGSGGGVSFVGVTKYSYSTASYNGGAGRGEHTDFIFSAESPSDLQFVAEGTAHENGHGFGLNHQVDRFTDASGVTHTSSYSTNNDASGNGSYAPIMGDSYDVQRGTWRSGTTSSSTQNDVTVISANTGIGAYANDGIGHTLATATPLPLSGTAVDYTAADGVIVPKSSSSPNPIGSDNYTADYFKFGTLGGKLTLKLNDGNDLLNPGTADAGATLEGVLTILDLSGNVIAIGTEATNTLSSTYSGTLSAGTYVAAITSNGGYTSTFDTAADYYSMGSYFLTGSGFTAVPEPTLLMLVPVTLGLLGRRRKRA